MPFRRLFGKRRATAPRQAAAPDGLRVYAIGDVHGRLDLLTDLLGRIEADHAARDPADAHIVMLGDLIDRGPHSRGVVEYLLNQRPSFATFHFLMGNHEEGMLKSLELKADPRETGWLQYGGRETLESYDVPEAAFAVTGWLLSDELRLYIPPEHLAFLATFEDKLLLGDYLFVHAGIRPNVPLAKQTPADMRWIRRDFLDDESDHGVIVVHGHSIREEPEFRPNRIGIDTGAYYSGKLTALGLEGEERWILATEPDEEQG
jgi:serine/threonine protein phosphatase 1